MADIKKHFAGFSKLQLYIVMYFVGIIAGVVAFCNMYDVIYPAMSLYEELRIDKLFRNDAPNTANVLGYLIVQRIKRFGLFLLTQMTVIKHFSVCTFLALWGFAGAVLEAFFINRYGGLGVLMFGVTVFPHYIFYACAGYILCTNEIVPKIISKDTVIAVIKVITTVLLLIILGCLWEGTLGLEILKEIIKFSV